MKKFKILVTYTTRPFEKERDISDVTHIFVCNDEADYILKYEKLLAYTEIGPNRYFAIRSQLKDNNLYIIDPGGLEYLKSHNPDLKLNIISIQADEGTRLNRALNDRKSSIETYKNRIKNEKDLFDKFEFETKNYDKVFYNNSTSNLSKLLNEIIEYIESVYTDDTLFCIVGRSCSGKDLICNYIVDYFNKKED